MTSIVIGKFLTSQETDVIANGPSSTLASLLAKYTAEGFAFLAFPLIVGEPSPGWSNIYEIHSNLNLKGMEDSCKNAIIISIYVALDNRALVLPVIDKKFATLDQWKAIMDYLQYLGIRNAFISEEITDADSMAFLESMSLNIYYSHEYMRGNTSKLERALRLSQVTGMSADSVLAANPKLILDDSHGELDLSTPEADVFLRLIVSGIPICLNPNGNAQDLSALLQKQFAFIPEYIWPALDCLQDPLQVACILWS